MQINIAGRGVTIVEQIAGTEKFVVQKTGEILQLAKDQTMDLWHVVSVVDAGKVEVEVKKVANTVVTDVKTDANTVVGKVEHVAEEVANTAESELHKIERAIESLIHHKK